MPQAGVRKGLKAQPEAAIYDVYNDFWDTVMLEIVQFCPFNNVLFNTRGDLSIV